jgi:transposase InsO family protein
VVFVKFQEFKALVENWTDKKINILRSDNGSKYTSKNFDAFLKDVGIKSVLIVP